MSAVFALLLIAAAQAAELSPAEQRREAGELLRQLLAEDDRPFLHRRTDGTVRLVARTRPRASGIGGLCEHDVLTVERAADGGIREVEAEREYAVLADADERPRWELEGDALTRACVAALNDETPWFTAEYPDLAKDAVIALFALEDAAREPQAPRIEWACARPECPDPATLPGMIDPLNPIAVRAERFRPCPADSRYLVVPLADGCGTWNVQLRLAPEGEVQLRSARIGFFSNDQRMCGI